MDRLPIGNIDNAAKPGLQPLDRLDDRARADRMMATFCLDRSCVGQAPSRSRGSRRSTAPARTTAPWRRDDDTTTLSNMRARMPVQGNHASTHRPPDDPNRTTLHR
jgi:hypothetical protein